MVILISGEFGRQLSANENRGTHHGGGNHMFVMGPRVRGGLYGDIFPEAAIVRYDQSSADIDGLTSIERLFGSIVDSMQPGSAPLVFPQGGESALEARVDFSSLLISLQTSHYLYPLTAAFFTIAPLGHTRAQAPHSTQESVIL